jgi:hypothetical protein
MKGAYILQHSTAHIVPLTSRALRSLSYNIQSPGAGQSLYNAIHLCSSSSQSHSPSEALKAHGIEQQLCADIHSRDVPDRQSSFVHRCLLRLGPGSCFSRNSPQWTRLRYTTEPVVLLVLSSEDSWRLDTHLGRCRLHQPERRGREESTGSDYGQSVLERRRGERMVRAPASTELDAMARICCENFRE